MKQMYFKTTLHEIAQKEKKSFTLGLTVMCTTRKPKSIDKSRYNVKVHTVKQ